MLKVCIIGESGHFSEAAACAAGNKDFIIAAVSDGPENKGCERAYTEALKSNAEVKRYTEYKEMLDAEKPDIAVVNPYLTYNAQVSIECLERGIHVFCEKPAAITMEDLENLKTACKNSTAIYSNMLNLRFSPAVIAAKQFVSQGGVGNIRLINTQKSYKLGNRNEMYRNKELYGGTIPWVGSHAVDWIYYFSQKRFVNVFANQSAISNNGHGDLEVTAVCCFTLDDEISATASIDYLRPKAAAVHGDDRIRIVGDKGIAEVRGGEAIVIDCHGERILPKEANVRIFDEFIKAVKGKENQLPDAEDVLYVTEICLKARMSAESGTLINVKR